LSLWQVAKDLGLISMGMPRSCAFDFGLAGAVAADARPASPQIMRRAAIVSSPDIGAALELDGKAGASMLQSRLTFAMTSQAGGM
jgi:hypothetical protein